MADLPILPVGAPPPHDLFEIPRRVANQLQRLLNPPAIVTARLVQQLGRFAEMCQCSAVVVHGAHRIAIEGQVTDG